MRNQERVGQLCGAVPLLGWGVYPTAGAKRPPTRFRVLILPGTRPSTLGDHLPSTDL